MFDVQITTTQKCTVVTCSRIIRIAKKEINMRKLLLVLLCFVCLLVTSEARGRSCVPHRGGCINWGRRHHIDNRSCALRRGRGICTPLGRRCRCIPLTLRPGVLHHPGDSE